MKPRRWSSVESNPFMITSNQSYGMSLSDQKAQLEEVCSNAIIKPPMMHVNQTPHNKSNKPFATCEEYDLSFLYSRESDRIGNEVTCSDSTLAKVLCEKSSISETRKKFRDISSEDAVHNTNIRHRKNRGTNDLNDNTKLQKHNDLNKALETSYVHDPIQQNALYMTSANDFGYKKPSAATYTVVRHARSQDFSNSYNKNMFRDQGLNTSLTRSNVHKHLDPQFV